MRGEVVTNSMRQWRIPCLVKEQKQPFLQVSELKYLCIFRWGLATLPWLALSF